ncbi:RNA-binding protein, putative [Trypanosoma brucei gambiense DAL972]|uniref:Peptidyl-prolyl cis-trans isomerase n=1 Tax=Trypanosoma brucei gambiense (strain MHOM/CI/86/DAL972) TaxID=679716 RepID=C9ZPQ4_TRYB9|nr:RNA-binding protein, putative [Trypanosoma brucei gambiense DAL972]CBH11382.1 RNA-binding protein, putative [Trypanosoma brucei gambiense DAL972]|eukprot:XP_011773669.1 RNA-binding protein, putative [Trypanosoma brucei gambiense DAL972]
MPSSSLSSPHPLVTAAILLETSLGELVVDLYGADCPVATAELVNLCRCKYFNGCIATEVVPDNVMILAHPVEELRRQTFASLLEASGQCHQLGGDTASDGRAVKQLIYNEWKRMRRHTAQLRRNSGASGKAEAGRLEFVPQSASNAVGAIRRSGLLLLEVPKVDGGGSNDEISPKMQLLITLSNRHQDYFEDNFMVLGEVREGNNVVEKMRVAPHRRLTSVSGITTRPSRLIRIRHMTVLPTAGTDAFADISHRDRRKTMEENNLSSHLAQVGCFRHWATLGAVQAANKGLVSLLKREASKNTARKGRKGSSDETESFSGCEFLVIPEDSAQGGARNFPNHDTNNGDDYDILSVKYNPHFHGDYLSSDDDTDGDGNFGPRKEREKRQQEKMRLHQDKLNETRALTLNLLDGIGDASGELKPEGNVLFVCRLNPLTTSEGLEMCFSQFGKVKSAQVIRDSKTGDSLCYGFVEFADEETCYRAHQKMDNALIDDRRIHVDFSQSVSKLWMEKQRELRKRARQ